MARYTGAVCRLCRRERMKLFLKGTKCDSMRCPIERRPYPPGQHGRGRVRDSEYLLQLREKQKCRRIYGLLEKQFQLIYAKANKQPGITGENLLRLLELRLDNVVFRTAFAASRNQSRQLQRIPHIPRAGHHAATSIRGDCLLYQPQSTHAQGELDCRKQDKREQEFAPLRRGKITQLCQVGHRR